MNYIARAFGCVSVVLLASTLTISPAASQPVVTGQTISWPEDGWYQVQTEVDYSEICAGGNSCTVPPGSYVVINHTTGQRFEGIKIGSISLEPSSQGPTVAGNTIMWPDNGWYQVQDIATFAQICGGGRSCEVDAGVYLVINHDSGERFTITVGESAPTDIVITGNMISWPDDGWYQVQDADTYTELCAGGRSCTVPNGVYKVVNHTTGQTYRNVIVSSNQPPIDVDPPVAEDSMLTPLPVPPLTPGPGPASEPVASNAPGSQLYRFNPLRNPAQNFQQGPDPLDDEDFLAGPLPSVVSAPDTINTAGNEPPFFEGLTDQDVLAGEELRIRFIAIDPDGGLPGLVPGELPDRARFVDNQDGTRTLVWTPLESDVGIIEFTIAATDPILSRYRTTRTLRIRVRLPEDTSKIPNVAPEILLVRPRLARVNEPFVFYIRTRDPNGDIAQLNVLNPPDGLDVRTSQTEPDVTAIRFQSDSPRSLTLQLEATDARDTSLKASETVRVDIVSEDDVARTGERLRDLASRRGLRIGHAVLSDFSSQPDGPLFTDISGDEFDSVTSENSLKWDLINPVPGIYQWAAADNLVRHAKSRNQSVHGHTLVWYFQLPHWIRQTPLTTRESHMREYIDRVLTRYKNDIDVWDVVNEALEDDGTFRQSVWYEAMGEYYIETAFRQARLSAPDATLLYNEYDIEFDGPKADSMLELVRGLKASDVPIDGVGFQTHLFADFDRFDELERIVEQVAELGLDIYFTEVDVSMASGQTLADQANVYSRVLSVCLEQIRCKSFNLWGLTDRHSWRTQYTPLLFDERYRRKSAYTAVQNRLK